MPGQAVISVQRKSWHAVTGPHSTEEPALKLLGLRRYCLLGCAVCTLVDVS